MASSSGKKLGQRIKEFRLDKQMTQKRLAAFLGISLPTVVRLEAGKGCSDLTRAKIEKILEQQTQVVAA